MLWKTVTDNTVEAIYLSDRVFVMSLGPGQIVDEMKVDLERPRNRNSSFFVELRQHIMDRLDIQ